MGFHRADTWKDIGGQIRSLADDCNRVLTCMAVPADDVRRTSLVKMRQMCNTLGSVPLILQHNAMVPERQGVVMSALGVTNAKDLEGLLRDFNSNGKLAFIVGMQFVLEHALKRVLVSLPRESSEHTFAKASAKLLEVLDIPERDQKQKVLLAMAKVRNSLHADGVHGWPDCSVNIAGEVYEFVKGRRVSCASWSHISWAYRHAIRIFEECLDTPEVLALQHIETDCAWP